MILSSQRKAYKSQSLNGKQHQFQQQHQSNSNRNATALKQPTKHNTNDMSAIRIVNFFILVAFLIAAVAVETDAAYRKPPFNGSIFGKRNSAEYDNAKAVTAMCEIAMEACQSWFPQSDSK